MKNQGDSRSMLAVASSIVEFALVLAGLDQLDPFRFIRGIEGDEQRIANDVLVRRQQEPDRMLVYLRAGDFFDARPVWLHNERQAERRALAIEEALAELEAETIEGAPVSAQQLRRRFRRFRRLRLFSHRWGCGLERGDLRRLKALHAGNAVIGEGRMEPDMEILPRRERQFDAVPQRPIGAGRLAERARRIEHEMPVTGIANVRPLHEAEQELGQRLLVTVIMTMTVCAGCVRVPRWSWPMRMLVRRLIPAMRMPPPAPGVSMAVWLRLAGLVGVPVFAMAVAVLVAVVLIRRPMLVWMAGLANFDRFLAEWLLFADCRSDAAKQHAGRNQSRRHAHLPPALHDPPLHTYICYNITFYPRVNPQKRAVGGSAALIAHL